MLKNITFTFLIKLLIAALNLVVVIFLSRYLGAVGKGQATFILASITMYLIGYNIVGGATLVFLVPRYGMKLLLLAGYSWTIATSVLLFTLVHFFRWIPTEFEAPVLILSMIDSFFNINTTLLVGKEKFKSVNFLYFVKALITAGALVLFFTVFNRHDVQAYIFTLYFTFSVTFLISLLFILKNGLLEAGSQRGIQQVLIHCFQLGKINQTAHILQFTSLRLSYFLLSNFSDNAGLGIYSNGIVVTESIWLISNSVATVHYARIANSKDDNASIDLTIQLSRLSSLICLGLVIVLAILPASVYVFIFGPEFLNVKQVIYTLIPGVLLYNTALVVGHYFSGIGQYWTSVRANFLGLLVTIGLSLVAISYGYSIFFAGIIASISYTVTTFVFVISFCNKNNIVPFQLVPQLNDLKKCFKLA